MTTGAKVKVTDSAEYMSSMKTVSRKPFGQEVISFVATAWDAVAEKI